MAFQTDYSSSQRKCIFVELVDNCSANLLYEVFINISISREKTDIELVMAEMVLKNNALSQLFLKRGYHFLIESYYKRRKWVLFDHNFSLNAFSELPLVRNSDLGLESDKNDSPTVFQEQPNNSNSMYSFNFIFVITIFIAVCFYVFLQIYIQRFF